MWWTFPALASTWNIPGDYPSIEAAVLSGVVIDGDELFLEAGEHPGYHFSAGGPTSLTLRGEGPTTVIRTPLVGGVALRLRSGSWTLRDLTIDPDYAGRGLRVEPLAEVDLIDVTITRGEAGAGALGGGIWIESQASVHAQGLTVNDCYADAGGGIAVEAGGMLTGVVVLDANAALAGGGLYTDGAVDLDTGSHIIGNTAQEGAGVYVSGMFAALGTSIDGNSASGSGGGISSGTSTAVIDIAYSWFTGNQAEQYGGAIHGAGFWEVGSTAFAGNTAVQVGGGSYLYASTTSFDNTSWCNNLAGAGFGHALFAEPSANTQVINAYLGFNGGVLGGTTVFGPGTWNIENVLFHENVGTYAVDTDGPLTMHGVVFAGSGLRATSPVDVATNLFDPSVAFDTTADETLQTFADPQIDTTFGCQPYVGFPYATAPGIYDQGGLYLDLDGSPADIGHLGGTGLDIDFFGADIDGDDSLVHVDCDDEEAAAYPGNTETCDSIDNDCDGTTDEAGLTIYDDFDQDGYGAGNPHPGCLTSTHVLVDGDCVDTNPAINPGAADNTCDGVDNDCDQMTDEDATGSPWYPDLDADGFGDDGSSAVNACVAPPLHVSDNTDCDDTRTAINPTATEICDGADNDCDGQADNGLTTRSYYLDDDGDGFGTGTAVEGCAPPGSDWVEDDGDCDDADPSTYPGAPEQCDLIDHNCNGPVDDGVTQQNWYPDADQDGFGAGTAVVSCAPVANHVLDASDCAPADAAINPDADEICDLIDNDCDGLIDDADDAVTSPTVWYADTDDDSFGDPAVTIEQCSMPPGHVLRADDCDDTEPSVYLGAPEACVDNLDNDCDGLIDAEDIEDYSFDPVAYGNDADDDGYGDPASTVLACSGAQPLGYVPMIFGEDCDDVNSLVNPGQPEICDALDNDCINGPDSGLPFLDYFIDADGDLFGDPASSPVNSCVRPVGRSGNALDCDDTNAARNPLAPEQCNDVDDNCNFQIDEGLPVFDLYPDVDDDGYGDIDGVPEATCGSVDGYVDDATDCDDTDPGVHPGVIDDPDDGIDADCDGTVEEPTLPDVDSDDDGVPDRIDVNPLSAGTAIEVEPPTPVYGCGCSATTAPSWVGGLLFFGLLGLRHRR